jgi:signal transduction histidine kinase
LLNAAQAIGSDGEITISLQALRTEQGARAQQVVISDTGPGIGEEDLERIWTPFYSTKAKGTGLGLSIVRKIAEAHGGRVWAEGAAGGAVFVVRLPGERRDRRPAAARSAPQAQADAPGAWRKLDLYRDYAAALTTTAAEGDD